MKATYSVGITTCDDSCELMFDNLLTRALSGFINSSAAVMEPFTKKLWQESSIASPPAWKTEYNTFISTGQPHTLASAELASLICLSMLREGPHWSTDES